MLSPINAEMTSKTASWRPVSDEWQESHLFMEQPTSSLDSYIMLLKINKNLPLSIISALWKDRILNVFSKLELWSTDLFSKISNILLSGQVFKSPSSTFHMTAVESALLSSESFILLKVHCVPVCIILTLFSHEYLKILLLLKENNSWYWPGYGQSL